MWWGVCVPERPPGAQGIRRGCANYLTPKEKKIPLTTTGRHDRWTLRSLSYVHLDLRPPRPPCYPISMEVGRIGSAAWENNHSTAHKCRRKSMEQNNTKTKKANGNKIQNNNEENKSMEQNQNQNSIADQAKTAIAGFTSVNTDHGSLLEQGFIIDDFDKQEKNLREAILKQMDESGLARCIGTPEMMKRAQENSVLGVVSRTILSLCKCHKKNGSYLLHRILDDATPHTSANRKTGKVDVPKAVASALAKLMAGTADHYEKDGTFVKASNPVNFSIEKRRNANQWVLHFRD